MVRKLNRRDRSSHKVSVLVRPVSQFGVTILMPASSFDKTKLEEMLREERTKGIKPGGMVVFTAVLYNADDNQDRLHSRPQ
jgi:hypothetical protein